MKKWILSVLLLPQLASAFTLNSQTDSDFRGWEDAEIKFDVNSANCPAGVDVKGLIEDAGKVWNNVATSRVKVSYGTTTTSTTYGNPTTVMCLTNFGTVTGADEDSVPGAAAITYNGHYAAGGVLLLNASSGQANISLYNRTLLLVILAHEIGHVIGLGHSQDPAALMYYNAGAKEHMTLAQDDIDGISYLYPRNELGGDKILGCGLVSTIHSPKPPSGRFLAVLALLFLLPVAVYSKLRWSASRV